MKDFDKAWERLVTLARQAPEDAAVVPPGFATRVVARSIEGRRAPEEFFFRYALRALGVAAALAVVCAVSNFNILSGDTIASELADDPVSEIVTQL